MHVSMLSPRGGGRPGICGAFDMWLCSHPGAAFKKQKPQGEPQVLNHINFLIFTTFTVNFYGILRYTRCYIYTFTIFVCLPRDSDIYMTILEHMFEEYDYEGSIEFANCISEFLKISFTFNF